MTEGRDRKIAVLLFVVILGVCALELVLPAPVPAGVLGMTGGVQFLTDGYGPRANPMGGGAPGSFHPGVDYASRIGTPVLALEDGLVTACRYGDRIYGTYMVVKDADGFEVMYAHLSQPLYPRGSVVARGQRIALSGNTGQSTGPHTHEQVMMSPELYMRLVAFRHRSTEPIEWRYRK